MRTLVGLVVACATLLSACGGGGGGSSGSGGSDGGYVETLYVSVVYPNNAVSLYQPVTITPQTSGFQGYTPVCSVANGGLPAGLQLQSDCTITGRPVEATRTWLTVRVGAVNVSNTIDVIADVTVEGPRLVYPDHLYDAPLGIGSTVNDFPSTSGWTAAGDLSMSWSYSFHSGSLPDGLSFDPVTGRVSGTVQNSGNYLAFIKGTLQTQFGTYETYEGGYRASVGVPAVQYPTAGAGINTAIAYISQPFNLVPHFYGAHLPDASLSGASFDSSPSPPPPAGLSMNAAGVVQGVPTALRLQRRYNMSATVTQGGVSHATQGSLDIRVDSPVSYTYSGMTFARGIPMSATPTLVLHSPTPLLPGATRTFTPRIGYCLLPTGVGIDAATGTFSGTPTAGGSFYCLIDVENTNNGVSWSSSLGVTLVVQ